MTDSSRHSSSFNPRKRKSSPAGTPSSSQTYKQGTLKDHFVPRPGPRSLSPTIKRSRSASVEASPEPLIILQKDEMMSFANSEVDHIDLTSSPPPSSNCSMVSVKPAGRPPPFQPHGGGPRKIVIKNLRKKDSGKSDAETYFEKTWVALDRALSAIFGREKVEMSMEELYRGVENICRADKAPALFKRLRDRLDTYVGETLRTRIFEHFNGDDVLALRAVQGGWEKWTEQLSTIRAIFFYLDRSYLYCSPKEQTLEQLGTTLFRQYITKDVKVDGHILRGIFELFTQDRLRRTPDEASDRHLLACVRMISAVNLYPKFETEFLKYSTHYYGELAKTELDSMFDQYVRECESQLERELAMSERFNLKPSTKQQLVAIVEEQMIRANVTMLTKESELRRLVLVKEDQPSVKLLYDILKRIGDAGKLLRESWEAIVLSKGTEIVTDQGNDTDMVPNLLKFKGRMESVVRHSFSSNDTLDTAMRRAFGTFINQRRPQDRAANNSKPAEMIAKHVDMLLRTGPKNSQLDEESVLIAELEKVLDLFRFIQGKDVFEAFYKKDLARRLLMGRSTSLDAEKTMLTKLKNECGAGFTHNLEGMFKDMDLSKETVLSFRDSKTAVQASQGVELYVNILSSAAWPTYPDIPVELPAGIMTYLNKFRDYYVSKHNGRRLEWRHNLSHCILTADFPKGKHELVLSAHQAVVLLLFMTPSAGPSQILSYPLLSTLTRLPPPELKRTLQSLACGKSRVLAKSPKGREVAETDKFTVNRHFQDAKYRIKVNQIQLKETKEENTETHERVARDRRFETQAAVIRIMKGRQRVGHNELIAATIEATRTRGMLDVGDIKKNIERLIDREYMMRDEEEPNYYIYVA